MTFQEWRRKNPYLGLGYDREELARFAFNEGRAEAGAEIKRLREALAFYADKRNYIWRLSEETVPAMYGAYESPKVRTDEGQIARAALEGKSKDADEATK